MDATGAAIAGAKVNASLTEVAMGMAVRYIECDEHGSFIFPVYKYGKYAIAAKKEDSGYADTGFYYPKLVPTIEVSAENPNPKVVVNLGPKAAVLSGTVRAANTGRPVQSAFRLRWVNEPSRWFSTSENPSFHVLIPPREDISLDVTAPGYEKWTDGAHQDFHLEPAAEVHLDIRLQRSSDPEFGHLRYLIPDGYVGWVKVRFDVTGATSASSESDVMLLRIPTSGELQTSAIAPQIGVEEEYLYYSPDGSTRAVPNDYWSDHGMVWGEHEVIRGGRRSEIDFYVGTEEQVLQHISATERQFWTIQQTKTQPPQ